MANTKHIYEIFQLQQFCAKLHNSGYIKWKNRNEIEVDWSKKNIYFGVVIIVLFIYLLVDTLYYISVHMSFTVTEIIYIYEIPMMYIFMMKLCYFLYTNNEIPCNIMDMLNLIHQETMKYSKLNTQTTFTDLVLAYCSAFACVYMITELGTLCIYFYQPSLKMHALQFLATGFVANYIILLIMVRVVFLKNISVWNTIIDNYAEKREIICFCKHCKIPKQSSNILCNKHFIR